MDLTYDAFVSYSRADKAFVERLVKHLERFAPPKALGLPARRLRVFIDTKDLVGIGYYDAVERALLSARKLIVVCSPSARKSPYVDDEIRRFLKAQDRTGRDIIPILLDGIPNNEARTPEQESIKVFPEVFYDYIEMPLAVDYLRFDLRRSKLDDGAYANSWFVLLANILDVNREELEEREAKRRRQRRLTIGAISGTVMVALTMLSIVAFWQRNEAVDQRQKAYARQLAAQAQLGLADTIAPPQQALKQALVSRQLASNKEAIEALKTGIERLPPTHVSRLAMDEKDAMGDLSFSPNGGWVVGASEKDIRVWRASDGARVFRQAVDTQMELRGFTADGRHALYLPRKQDRQQDPVSVTPQLVVLQINGRGDGFELKSHRFERILDAIVAGHGLFALVSNVTGKRISVQDLLREETIGTLELRQAVVLGALDAKTGESIIVDAAGNVRRLGYGLDTGKAEFKLPTRDRPLAIGPMGGAPSPPQASIGMPIMSGGIIGAPNRSVLITQRADHGLTILSLANGQAVRELGPEQASDFRGFVAAGMLFATTGTQTGVSLFTLDGQLVTSLVHSRAKDWDLSQMGVIGRQDPVIDVGASDDAQTVVTARKDGGISVWRPTLSPRIGTWGAMPMPDMESIAHFDHGNELGETVTWSGPPVLSVSPDGRYVASQSMGLEPNPAGGIKKLNPLLRIWDTRQRKEIGRFYPLGGMAVKFAPSGNLLLTASVPRELLLDRSKSDTKKTISLDVWRLSPYLFEKLRRSEVTRRSTPPLCVRADPAFSNTTGVAVSPTGQRAVWVGSDLRLRAWDAASPDVAVVEDLVPVIERIFAAQSELFSKRANEHKESDVRQRSDLPSVENLVKNWRAATKEIRADWPIGIPIAISGNGCCALLAIGTTLRLYDLATKGLIGERIVDDFVSTIEPYTTGPNGLGIDDILLSDNGRFFLAVGTTRDQHEAMQQYRRGGLSEELATEKIELRAYSAIGKNPPLIKSMTLPVLPSPLLPIRGMVPLAIDPTGRRIVVDKIELPSKAGRAIVPSRSLQIIDFQDGKAPLELFTEQWMPTHPMDFGSMLKTRSAAFSGDGRYIAVRLTEPECRSVGSMSMQIPSCSGVRISYTVWDIQTGQQSADMEDVAESGFNPLLLMMPPSANTETAPATVQSPWTARTDPQQRPEVGNGNTGDSKAQAGAGITAKFTESDPYREWIIAMQRLSRMPKEAIQLYGLLVPTAKLTGFARAGSGFMLDADNAIVTTQTQDDTGSGSPLLITRRLNPSADSVVEEACARLEPEHRAFSPAQWASQFPGASFHPICASTGAHR